MDPSSRRRRAPRTVAGGGGAGGRHGHPGDARPGCDRPGVARPDPCQRPRGGCLRGLGRPERLGSSTRTRPCGRFRTSGAGHVGGSALDGRASRSAAGGDRHARPCRRAEAGQLGRPGDAVGSNDALAGAVRGAGGRPVLAVPGPSPRGSREDRDPVVVAISRRRDPCQGDILDAGDRGSRHPRACRRAGRAGRERHANRHETADVRSRRARAGTLTAIGRSGAPERRCRRPRRRARPGR